MFVRHGYCTKVQSESEKLETSSVEKSSYIFENVKMGHTSSRTNLAANLESGSSKLSVRLKKDDVRTSVPTDTLSQCSSQTGFTVKVPNEMFR